MDKPQHHLFICGSARVTGELKGACKKHDSIDLLSYAQNEVMDRMMEGVEVSMTGCLNICGRGPIVIDYPTGAFYEKADEELLDEILDAIQEGRICETNRIGD